MKFEYEITPEIYVSSQRFYYDLSGHNLFQRGLAWLLLGAALIFLAFFESSGWPPAVLVIVGAWWAYCGFMNLFPGTHFRKAYAKTDFSGRRFHAEINDEGFEVSSDVAVWKMKWPAVSLRGENKDTFTMVAEGIIFMFGKKYLSEAEQQELRKMAKLPNP